jgi:hypothetical protein
VAAAFVVGFVLSVGLAVGALLAWDSGYEGRILPGVGVHGVDLAGMDRSEATAALTAAYEPVGAGHVVLRTAAGDLAVPYRAFARRVDVAARVDEALGAGRLGSPIDRAVGQVRMAMTGILLEPRLVLDEARLSATVQRAVARLDRPPTDSVLTIDPNGVHRTLASRGRSFDAAAAAVAAFEAVRRVDAPAEVVVDVVGTEIEPAFGDEAALAVQAAAMRMATDVTLTDGKQRWTIRAAMIRGWMRLEAGADGTLQPVVDEAAIARSFRKVVSDVKRDPVSARYLKTRGGRIVGVIAASNGRRLDAEGTAAAIASSLAARATGAPAAAVKVKVATVEPKLTTAEAVRNGAQMFRLGTWRIYKKYPILSVIYSSPMIFQ